VEEAERVFEEFERNHHPGWDLRVFIREYIFLYVTRFGTNRLPALQFKARFDDPVGSIAEKVC
jgi:hypothetical protein